MRNPVEYKVLPVEGVVRVNRLNGSRIAWTVESFNNRAVAERIAAELNNAYAAGVAEGRRQGRDAVAEMLESRFADDGLGEWQDGWREAAKYAREHRV